MNELVNLKCISCRKTFPVWREVTIDQYFVAFTRGNTFEMHFVVFNELNKVFESMKFVFVGKRRGEARTCVAWKDSC